MLGFMNRSNNKKINITNKLFWSSLADKTKLSLVGTLGVLSNWKYLLIAAFSSALFGVVLSLLTIGSFEFQLLTSSIALSAKLDIILNSLLRLLTSASTFVGMLTLTTAMLQGVVISLIVFNLREQRKLNQGAGTIKNEVAGSTLASIIAGVGAGCATCGASLLIPILSLISSSVAFIDSALLLVPIIAIALLIYSIWNLGHTSFMFKGFPFNKATKTSKG